MLSLIEAPVRWATAPLLQTVPFLPPWAVFGRAWVAGSVNEVAIVGVIGGAFYALFGAIIGLLRYPVGRKHVGGFVVRFFLASIIGALSWYSCVSPIGDFPRLQSIACYVIGAPVVAVERYGSWCDFCSPDELMWRNLRIAVPVYILLLYVPAAIRATVRRVREKRTDVLVGHDR